MKKQKDGSKDEISEKISWKWNYFCNIKKTILRIEAKGESATTKVRRGRRIQIVKDGAVEIKNVRKYFMKTGQFLEYEERNRGIRRKCNNYAHRRPLRTYYNRCNNCGRRSTEKNGYERWKSRNQMKYQKRFDEDGIISEIPGKLFY